MTSSKPTQEGIKKGYQECAECGGILLMEAGFEVKISACTRCGQHVASADEFFNAPVELMSK